MAEKYPQEVHRLAEEILEDGEWNSVDGPRIMNLILTLDRAYRGVLPLDHQRYEKILIDLKALDNAYGWDYPYKSEALEDSILGLYVQMYAWARLKGMPWGA